MPEPSHTPIRDPDEPTDGDRPDALASLDTSPLSNRVLGQLPGEELDRLRSLAWRSELPPTHVLSTRGRPIEAICWPLSGLASIATSDRSGTAVQVMAIGREGIVGVTALFGSPVLPFDVIWQVAGEAIMVRLDDARRLLPLVPRLEELATGYLSSLLVQVGQNVACNRIHDMEQRAAKCLLLARDHLGSDHLELTQELLASMLGVTRPKLSVVERVLRGAGLVSARRHGGLHILDRAGLEERACECYSVIRGEIVSLYEA